MKVIDAEVAMIEGANRRHDKHYGWTPKMPFVYANWDRMPEYVHIPANKGLSEEEIWDWINLQSEVKRLTERRNDVTPLDGEPAIWYQ